MARKKTERLEMRISETLDDFLDSEKENMQQNLGKHVSKAEVGRRMLNVFMYLNMSPEADLGKIVNHAAKFEEFLKEEYSDHEDVNLESEDIET